MTTTYTGPIFDGDSHIIEPLDCEAWNHYLPAEFKPKWSYRWSKDPDGKFVMYAGPHRVDVTADFYSNEGQNVPPPGKLHEWLRSMKEGKENVDMRVPMTAPMTKRTARLQLLDEFGVEGSLLFPGNHVGTIGYLAGDGAGGFALRRPGRNRCHAAE